MDKLWREECKTTFVQTRYDLRSSARLYAEAGKKDGLPQHLLDFDPDLFLLDEGSNPASSSFLTTSGSASADKDRCQFIWLNGQGKLLPPHNAGWRGETRQTRPAPSSSSTAEAPGPSPRIDKKRSGSPLASEPVAKKGHRGGRNQKRGGKKHREDGSGPFSSARLESLRQHLLLCAKVVKSQGFDALAHANRTQSGWQGALPPAAAREQLNRAWDTDGLDELIKDMKLLYCDREPGPLALFDACGRLICVRTAPVAGEWLKDKSGEFYSAIEFIIGPHLRSDKQFRLSKEGARGPHLAFIMGHHRPFTPEPVRTEFWTRNEEAVQEFRRRPVINQLVTWVTFLVQLYFPAIAKRYQDCAEWHKEKYGIIPLWGLFFSFCINGIYPGQQRIHCRPHADSKNIVGVCVLIVYQLPGTKFDHRKHSWLCIWEAGVIIEIPPWVAVLYPSCLFYHFNVDIKQLCIITTDSPHPPVQGAVHDDRHGRGSLVFFNQASMFQSSETDSSTIAEAKKKGVNTNIDFCKTLDELLKDPVYYHPL